MKGKKEDGRKEERWKEDGGKKGRKIEEGGMKQKQKKYRHRIGKIFAIHVTDKCFRIYKEFSR